MDHLGHITIELGDYFSFPDNFEKLFNDGDSALNSIFKISLAPNKFRRSDFIFEMVSYKPSKVVGIKRGKKIAERSRKELVGPDFEEFIDSDRYETTFKWTPHILVFKIIFD
jgi:hypothetical protein